MKDAIIFPVTYECNLSCSYCNIVKRKIDVEKSIKTISTMKNEWVFITGGEPLLLDNINDICDLLRMMGKKVGLTTNGTIQHCDIINHVDRLGVSIDGGQEITDRNRGKGTFSLAMNFIKSAVGKVETVMMATVIKDDPKLDIIAHDIGVDYLQVTHI